MESKSIIHYLLDFVEVENIGNNVRLASLSILNKFFLKEKGTSLQTKCLNSSLTSSLLTMLSSGLNELNDPLEAVTISIAMEILCQFSKLPANSIHCLVTETVIRTLLDYMNSDSKFYQFPASIKKVLSSVCEGKQLMGQVKVVAMSTEPLEYIHRHTKHKLKRVPDKIKICKLVDTELEEDLDVCEFLLEKQLAWPGRLPGVVVSESDDWENIIVTQVLDGGMFWAQVGETAIKGVNEIQRQLNECDDHVRRSSSLIGDTVVAYGEIMGNQCFLRAQVTSFDRCSVEVFAIDYGYTLKVSDVNIFILPENLNTKKVKRKISLCSVDGISPPPYDEELVHNAAAILVNLCKQNFSTGEILHRQDGLQVISNFLLHCPRPKLRAQVVTVLLNLAVSKKLTPHITNGGFVKILQDIIESYIKMGQEEMTSSESESTFHLLVTNDDKLLLARTVMCLTNILCWNVETRAQFYKQQGIDVILRFLACMTHRDPIYCFCVKLLRVFLHRPSIKHGTETRSQSTIKLQNTIGETQSVGMKASPQNSQALARGNINSKVETGDDTDGKTNDTITQEMLRSSSPVMEDVVESQVFLCGQMVNVCDDEQHEFCAQKVAKNIDVHLFAKHVCGMLNTGHGGSIYFGIDENSQVFGLELSRDDKDRFRLAVDRHLINKISPILLHSQFSIRDYPVIDPSTGQIIPDHYVIEISVKGSKGSIYTMENGACYYRFGSDTSALTRQAVRKLIVFEEEANYYLEIQNLERQKTKLLCDNA